MGNVHILRINVYLLHLANQPAMIKLHAIPYSLVSTNLMVYVQIKLVKIYMLMANVIHY